MTIICLKSILERNTEIPGKRVDSLHLFLPCSSPEFILVEEHSFLPKNIGVGSTFTVLKSERLDAISVNRIHVHYTVMLNNRIFLAYQTLSVLPFFLY